MMRKDKSGAPQQTASASQPHVASPETPGACSWCGQVLRSRRGGSAGRFCCAAHRTSYWAACRKFGEQAVALGIVSVAELKADPAACTLPGALKLPSPVPEAGRASNTSPEPQAEFVIRIPRDLVRSLIFRYCELQHSEEGDVIAILAALRRLGRRPTMSETSAGETVLSY